MAGRCVIRCNVNNLLLAVIVIESMFLGFYLLEAIYRAPGLAELPPKAAADGDEVTTQMPTEVEEGAESEDYLTATELSTRAFVTSLVFTIIQIAAVTFLVLGYKNQCFKPLLLFLAWFLISTIFLVVCWSYMAHIAHDSLPDLLLKSGDKTVVEVTDEASQGPLLVYTKRLAHRITCVVGPLLFLKIVLGLFELAAILMAVKYFKSLAPVPTSTDNGKADDGTELKDAVKEEKEKLVEEA